jgi:hypothetical protein
VEAWDFSTVGFVPRIRIYKWSFEDFIEFGGG